MLNIGRRRRLRSLRKKAGPNWPVAYGPPPLACALALAANWPASYAGLLLRSELACILLEHVRSGQFRCQCAHWHRSGRVYYSAEV
jgi:hypothetical protein